MIDSVHRAFVGHDLFYFADDRSRATFLRDPTRWSPTLTDPVTLGRFRATRRSPVTTFRGRRYVFATDSTLRAFEATPDSFAMRRGM